jgi:hypothetical protein
MRPNQYLINMKNESGIAETGVNKLLIEKEDVIIYYLSNCSYTQVIQVIKNDTKIRYQKWIKKHFLQLIDRHNNDF